MLAQRAAGPRHQTIGSVILKVASRCNLDCSYCYVYHSADSAWKRRPAMMPEDVFEAALERTRRHCLFTGQRHVHVAFHGGEPCLIGAERFDRWCARVREVLRGVEVVTIGIQTNGTLIDAAWAAAFRKHDVHVGLSSDGPKELHDAFRVDHTGAGSYDRVERGRAVLAAAGVGYEILCVIPLGADPLSVHRHFLSTGCKKVTYLLPDYTHDSIGPVRERYGPTPCADFLLPVFDDWWFNGTLDMRIGDLWNFARVVMGGSSKIETVGNRAPRYVFIEADGDIEGLDVLKVCEDGMSASRLNVMTDDLRAIADGGTMHAAAIFEGMPLPSGCGACVERDTCAGGYLPHRYARATGFDNRSVWCADLLAIFTHIRGRLGVSAGETAARKAALQAAR